MEGGQRDRFAESVTVRLHKKDTSRGYAFRWGVRVNGSCSFCIPERRCETSWCRRNEKAPDAVRHLALFQLYAVSGPRLAVRYQLHTGRPRGNAIVQFFVVPSCVITNFAVAVPSYVMTSRRDVVVGAAVPRVIAPDI